MCAEREGEGERKRERERERETPLETKPGLLLYFSNQNKDPRMTKEGFKINEK